MRVPLSVIGGYLGAGKTTLINQLLAFDHGVRLTVLVNDFGSINIDASLLQSATEDTIELTNGCVCCTLSADLFFSIGDLLDRELRPQHILVEASGIADPARIANVALTEKELQYAGIVVLVDGVNISEQLNNSYISSQVEQQLRCADLLVVSKTPATDTTVAQALKSMGFSQWGSCDDIPAICSLLLDTPMPNESSEQTAAENSSHFPGTHSEYVQWSDATPAALSHIELLMRLENRPNGLLRLKAILENPLGGYWEIHVVGKQSEIISRKSVARQGLTAIGISPLLSPDALEAWWLSDLDNM